MEDCATHNIKCSMTLTDCTGTLTTFYHAFTAHFSLVLVEDSKKAELVETDAGTVATGAVNR